MRRIVIFIFLALAACSANKRSTVRPENTEPYITESAIDVPEATGAATLVNATRLGEVSEGIQAMYRPNRLSDGVVDFFIYPAGSMSEIVGLAKGVEGFRKSLADAERYGIFSGVNVDATQAFAVVREDGSPLVASKLRLHFTKEGAAFESRAWIAYKQNYWFKLRMSAPVALASNLDDIGDAFARDLFRLAQARSKGACGQVSITLPAQPTQEQLVEGTLAAMQELNRKGCVTKDYPALEPGFRRTLLPFPLDACTSPAQ
jgi:hypothetical protein